MATIEENLQTISTSVQNMKTVLASKGVDTSGDITTWAAEIETSSSVGGGSSNSGGGVYSEVNHGTSDTTFTLTPNTFHVWGEVTSLDLSLGDATSGVMNEYIFQFTSGSTATTLTLPDDIKWTEDIVIESNMIYQISIVNGLGAVLSYNDSVQLIENRGTYTAGTMMSGATLIFEYPVASDLTIAFQYTESPSYILSAGQTTLNIDWYEPTAPIPTYVAPSQDNTYIYIIV